MTRPHAYDPSWWALFVAETREIAAAAGVTRTMLREQAAALAFEATDDAELRELVAIAAAPLDPRHAAVAVHVR